MGQHHAFGQDEAPLSYAVWARSRYIAEAEGYTNPNAACPVCHARVYFYHSPQGGRVYFDELGPPWPKHPCTDSQSFSMRPAEGGRAPVGHAGGAAFAYAWQRDGWTPFICDSFAIIATGECAALGGLVDGSRLVLFVTQRDFLVRAPYQIKRRDEATYFVSTVLSAGDTVMARDIIGYRHLKDASAARPRSRPVMAVAAVAVPKPKAVPLRTLPRAMQTPPNLPVTSPKTQLKTALQLAFEKAITKGSIN